MTVPRRTVPAGIALSPLIVIAFCNRAVTGASTCADADERVGVISRGSAVPAAIVTSRYSATGAAGAAASAGRLSSVID